MDAERGTFMGATSCLRLTEQITAAAKAVDQAGLLEVLNGDRAALALELVRQSLPEDELALFDAEARSLPEAMLRAVGELLVIACDNELSFDFVAAPPENVMDFARHGRVRLTLDMEDGGITATMQHTMRHPSWLPAVELPGTALTLVP